MFMDVVGCGFFPESTKIPEVKCIHIYPVLESVKAFNLF